LIDYGGRPSALSDQYLPARHGASFRSVDQRGLIVGHVSKSVVGIEKSFGETPVRYPLYPSLSVIGIHPPDLSINHICFALVAAAIRHASEDFDNSSDLKQ
jgi:hypothetical protein